MVEQHTTSNFIRLVEAIALPIAVEGLEHALVVGGTSELHGLKLLARGHTATVLFIRTVAAIVFSVAAPCLENALAISALVLVWFAHSVVV